MESIQFQVFAAEDVLAYSVCEVINNDPFTKTGEVCENGPCDLRMGSFDRYKCKTCGATEQCPGHFGHVALHKQMYNIIFLPLVAKILDTLCLKCCRVKLPSSETQIKSLDHLRQLVKPKKICPHCGMKVEAVTQAGGYLKRSTSYLHAHQVYEIFQRLSSSDLALLCLPGFSPSDLLFTYVPVLPNTERPTFDRYEGGHQRSVDKLTFKIREIVIANKKLTSFASAVPITKALEEQLLLTQDAVTMFYTDAYMKQSFTLQKNISAAYKRGALGDGASLQTRLRGKSGQLRSNIMGKRVNMTARTVIVGDPALDLNEIRVPVKVCMRLTVPERVTERNRVTLQALVDAGPDQLAGANNVVRSKDGPFEYDPTNVEVFDLRFASADTMGPLQVGDVVERHLAKGDVVMFNRQPTLHRYSFMAMKIVPGPGNAFGMNVCAYDLCFALHKSTGLLQKCL